MSGDIDPGECPIARFFGIGRGACGPATCFVRGFVDEVDDDGGGDTGGGDTGGDLSQLVSDLEADGQYYRNFESLKAGFVKLVAALKATGSGHLVIPPVASEEQNKSDEEV